MCIRDSGGTYSIEHGYNGRMTYDGILIYNDNGVIMNEGNYKLYTCLLYTSRCV